MTPCLFHCCHAGVTLPFSLRIEVNLSFTPQRNDTGMQPDGKSGATWASIQSFTSPQIRRMLKSSSHSATRFSVFLHTPPLAQFELSQSMGRD